MAAAAVAVALTVVVGGGGIRNMPDKERLRSCAGLVALPGKGRYIYFVSAVFRMFSVLNYPANLRNQHLI